MAVVPICIPQFYHPPFQLSVLDVGQGQAIFLRHGAYNMMIDMGGYYDEEKFSIGKQVIMPFLSVQGVSQLDQLILTHLIRTIVMLITALKTSSRFRISMPMK